MKIFSANLTLLLVSLVILLGRRNPAEAVSVKQAVVVGAGPAGMSAALVLARRHGCNVTGKTKEGEETWPSVMPVLHKFAGVMFRRQQRRLPVY